MVAFFIVLLVVIIGGTIFLATRAHSINTRVVESLAAKMKLGAEVRKIVGAQYLGGHPMHPISGTASFSFRERGFCMVAGKKVSGNRYSFIKSVDVVDQQQISKDVTLTRLLALGVFAFGAKKKTVTHDQYVKIVTEINGVETPFLIKSPQAGNIASQINAGRISIAN